MTDVVLTRLRPTSGQIYFSFDSGDENMAQRYFEDIAIDETHELGTWTITESEITSFAKRYDPQPFHVDESAAKESIYGGLIASGWQTVALTMRTMVDGFLQDVAGMGARGVDNLQWSNPVRPGDTISTQITILEKYSSEGAPTLGDVRARTTGTNTDGDVVVSWINNFLIERRDTE